MLRIIAARPHFVRPSSTSLRRTLLVRISSFLPPFCGFALNGGEGGIRTPGRVSTTTDFESVTFGHSATSPKSWDREAVQNHMASFD